MYMADPSRPRLQSFSSTSFFLLEVTHTFTKLLNDAAIFAIPFGNINHPAKAWWSPKIAEADAKRRNHLPTVNPPSSIWRTIPPI